MNKILLLLPLLFINSAYSVETTTVPASQGNVKSAKKTTAELPKPVDLKTAYKREYAFLEAQKRELKKRLSGFKEKAKAALMRELPEFSYAFAREKLFYLKGRNRLICIFRGCN